MSAAIRRDGRLMGFVERTNGGAWFADAVDGNGRTQPLGAYRSRHYAVAAIEAWHEGKSTVAGKIRPLFVIGEPPRGMEAS